MQANINKLLNDRVTNLTGLHYLNLVIFHIFIGFAIYLFKPISFVYMLGILIYFIIRIMRESYDPLVTLKACTYIVAAEVFLRMTDSLIFYETGKYSVILFIAFGLYYHNFKSSANIFIVFLLLLVPSIVTTYLSISYEHNFRKTILFNLSGEFCLMATALYCYKREVKFNDILKLLDFTTLPIIAMTTYLFFYTPNLQDVVTGAEGNFAASGGFGPNQVSTALGLGIFCLFVRLFLNHQNRILRIVVFILISLVTFRALATLSRGGVFTSFLMCLAFLFGFLRYAKPVIRSKSIVKLILLFIGGILIWSVTLVATNNMLYNKYTNRNANGQFQEDASTGRLKILETELEMFESNPFFGIGAGMGKFYRLDSFGSISASHNELTRLISEHGLFGIVIIFLLIITTLVHYFKNPKNIFVLPLTLFWLLTISHSAMRIAAPGFIYGLALLSVKTSTTKDED